MKSMKFMYIPEGVGEAWEEVEFDYDNHYAESIDEKIGCRIFEAVSVIIRKQQYLLLVDEEGLLKDKPIVNLPAWHWYSGCNPNHPIVGNVLVGKQGYVDGEPDIVGLEEDDVRLLRDVERLMSIGFADLLV